MFTPEDIYLINSGKLDSRVKGSAGHPVKEHAQYKLERTYCVMCLNPMGWVSMDSAEFIRVHKVICVCDDCIFTNGVPPLEEAPVREVK